MHSSFNDAIIGILLDPILLRQYISEAIYADMKYEICTSFPDTCWPHVKWP